MALTRSEIEILIKARNEAQGAFDTLSKQVTAVAGAGHTATASLEKVGAATKQAASAGGAANVAFGLLAERMARGLVGAFGDTIAAANKLDAGLIGLASVAKAFGNDAGLAQESAKALAADGLMSVGDAATSLKNLLAAGFGLKEANDLMIAFKNSAAFGRQGSLDFGEAIRGATEGIKNGNSILVDNAGVTKNLSVMLTDAGYSAQDLSKASSDVNIRMAIYNGIIKETNPMLGDTARFLDTAAGKQAAFSAQIEIAQQKLGKAMQPALLSVLSALTPFAVGIGNLASVLVPLGAAVAAVVAPLALMQVKTMLGIPSFATMTAAIKGTLGATLALPPALVATTTALQTTTNGLTTTTTAITVEGNAAAVAAAKTNLLKTAMMGIFLVPAAWEFGKSIGNLVLKIDDLGKNTDTTGGKIAATFTKYTGISALVASIQGITESVVLAADGTASFAVQMDTIAKATAVAGRQILSYAEAIEILTVKANPAEAAMEKYWKTLTKAPSLAPTLAQGEAIAAQFDKIAGAADISAKRIDGWNNELNRVAGAGGLATLRKELDLGVLSTKELAAQFGISEDAIKFYEKGLKNAGDAAKLHAKAADEAEKAAKKLGDELEKLGIVTEKTGKQKLKELTEPLTLLANVKGPAFQMALARMLPELEALAKMAGTSGVKIDGLAGAMERARKANEDAVAPMIAWENSLPTVAIEDLIGGTQRWTAEQELAGTRARMTADAFKFFGIQTRAELQATAAAATNAYNEIAASVGRNAPEAIAAYKKMIDAQKAASQEIPSVWTSEIFPKVKGVVSTLTDAVNGSFAQMLLGAKGFKDGFVDIWHSIKSAIGNILNSILSVFLNTFLKGIMGALSGQSGAMSSAFGAMFKGVGGGAGGGGFSLSGLFGGGGAAAAGGGGLSASAGGLAAGMEGAGAVGGGGAAAGGGGAAMGGAAAAIGGGLAAAGAGFMLGKVFQGVFGGAGVKSGIAGAASGAATGAMIGSIVPGLGTAVGALVGGIAGALGGLLGKSVGQKVNDIRDSFFAQFGGKGTGADSGFGNVAAQLAKVTVADSGGAGGEKLFKDLISAKNMADFEKAVKAAEAALLNLDAREAATAAAAKTSADARIAKEQAIRDEYTKTKDAITASLADVEKTMASLQESVAAEAPEAVMGSIEAAARAKLDELAKQKDALIAQLAEATEAERIALESVANDSAESAAAVIAGADAVAAKVKDGAAAWDEYARRGGIAGKSIRDGLDDLGGVAQATADEIAGAFAGVSVTIPVNYAVPAGIDGLPAPELPEAAGGVMAGQPGLVVFGEGGETEIGGPASFFKRIFESLAGGSGPGGQGGGQAPITIGPFNITAMSSSDLKGAIERDVIPPILDALRVNRRGSLTDMKTILGVA